MRDPFQQFSEAIVDLAAGSGLDWTVWRSVASTNSLARRIARQTPSRRQSTSALALIAWHQHAGRGRGDHQWQSAAGEGIWSTLLLQNRRPESLMRLPLLVGVALADAIQAQISTTVQLKWPNDLIVAGAKLGGILIEGTVRGTDCTSIVGFGVNYGSNPPAIESYPTTSVTLLTPEPPPLANLAVTLTTSVRSALQNPPSTDSLLDRFRKLSIHRAGDCMDLSTASGSISGHFREIDDHGMLILDTGQGLLRVDAAEIQNL